jgi:hypothetical protein
MGLRRLTAEQEERLMMGAPFGDHAELDELAAFMRALPAALATEPDGKRSAAVVPRLAEAARISAAETDARATTTVIGSRRSTSRRALVARVAVAVALIPACMAGLAFAGVTVPEPARQAFEDVGVTLPNQPSESPAQSNGEEGGASETAPNGKAKGKTGQPGQGPHLGKALGHGKGKANGNSGGADGNAGGSSGSAPGHTGASGSSHAKSGSSHSSSGAAHARKPVIPVPHGNARGLSK